METYLLKFLTYLKNSLNESCFYNSEPFSSNDYILAKLQLFLMYSQFLYHYWDYSDQQEGSPRMSQQSKPEAVPYFKKNKEHIVTNT